jgi:Transcriptional regulatory protein, C terminal
MASGAVVDRRRLLHAVWGYAPKVVSRAVDHTVYRLRRKIESDPAAPRWLTSQRAGGYRLEPESEHPTPARDADVLDHVWILLQQGDLAGARAVCGARVEGRLSGAHGRVRSAVAATRGDVKP